MNTQPRTLFLIDGLGAFLSTLMLGVVLVKLESCIGMPPHILYALAGVACVMGAYSGLCFLVRVSGSRFLRILAVANWMYCLVTIGLIAHHFAALSFWGIGYFTGEIILVSTLATVEWREGRKPAVIIQKM